MRSPSRPHPDPVRVPIQVLAALALACLVGALFAVAVAAAAHTPTALLWAALCIAGGVVAVLLVALGLAADPLRGRLAKRLEDVERRLDLLEAGGGDAAPSPASDRTFAGEAEAPPVRPPEPAIPPPAAGEPAAAPAEPAAVMVASDVDARPVPPVPAAAPEAASPAPGDRPAAAAGWELALGSRWLGRLGAAVLVVAVALFLKLGWDQGWFRPSPAARVLLGALLGAVLFAAGEVARRRRGYDALAQALGGAGLGTATLSLWAAVRLYGLLPSQPGILLLALLAGGTALYAAVTRGRVLAFLALAAGFAAPYLVPAPSRSGLLVLALATAFTAGAMAVTVCRGWPELPWLAAAGATLDLLRVLLGTPHPQPAVRLIQAGGLAVVAALFLAAAGLAARRRAPAHAGGSSALAAALMSSWTLLAGLTLLHPLGTSREAVLAMVFLALAAGARRLADRKELHPGPVAATAFGLAVFLPAAVLPTILFRHTAVGLGWAVLALATGWWGVARGRRSWQTAAAAFAALAWFPQVAEGVRPGPWAVPTATATAFLLYALAGLGTGRRDGAPSRVLALVAGPAAALAGLGWAKVVAARVLAYGGTLPGSAGAVTEMRAILAVAAGTVLLLLVRRAASPAAPASAALLLAAGLLPGHMAPDAAPVLAVLPQLRVLAAALAALALVLGSRLGENRWLHWCAGGAAALGAVLALVRLWPRWAALLHPGVALAQEGALLAAGVVLLGAGRAALHAAERPFGGWIEDAGWVTLLAAASHRLGCLVQAGGESRAGGTVPLSVLWGLAGLALLGYGLVSREAHRRYLGLAVLAVTVLKIFLRDLAAAGTGVRVLAFAVTGAALLLGSYLYVRFRTVLETDPVPEEPSGEAPDGW